MTRRGFLAGLTGAITAPGFLLGSAQAAEGTLGQLKKPASFWKPLVSPEAYGVLFHEDTEHSFSSPLYEEHRAGTFLCAACYLPLFSSKAKYNSGTGWPSFFEALRSAERRVGKEWRSRWSAYH